VPGELSGTQSGSLSLSLSDALSGSLSLFFFFFWGEGRYKGTQPKTLPDQGTKEPKETKEPESRSAEEEGKNQGERGTKHTNKPLPSSPLVLILSQEHQEQETAGKGEGEEGGKTELKKQTTLHKKKLETGNLTLLRKLRELLQPLKKRKRGKTNAKAKEAEATTTKTMPLAKKAKANYYL
jgi:hypothetical protein